MILYDPPEEKRKSAGILMNQRDSAWKDIPSILRNIVEDF